MRKLIVFMLAAVLVSCSQQETLEVKQQNFKDYKDTPYYGRYLDTIQSSNGYIIVAVYKSMNGISTVVIERTTRLD